MAIRVSYAYDQAADVTELDGESGYTYDAAGELTGSPSASYTYDQLGERTESTPAGGGAGTGYAYDQSGDLTSVTLPDGSTSSYTYDGSGELATASDSGGASSTFVWDTVQGSTPLLLSDGHTSYVYGPGGVAVEQIAQDGTVSYLHHDRIGSTRLITDSSGSTVGTTTYNPYGQPAGQTGTATSNLGYAGEYTDPETGLEYDQASWYDPSTGQFLSVDPDVEQTSQPYAYADDDPINATDPTGLCGSTSSWGAFWAGCGSDTVHTIASEVNNVIRTSPVGLALDIDRQVTGHTVGMCVGGEIGVAKVVSESLCYEATSSGQSCITESSGLTTGVGMGASLTGTMSSAQSCADLSGRFVGSAASVGPVAGSLAFGNRSDCSGPEWQANFGYGAGLGAMGKYLRLIPGLGASEGSTNTVILAQSG